MPFPELVDTKRAAQLLGLTVRALVKRREEGQPPAYVRIGQRTIRYRLDDLLALVEEGRVEPTNGGAG